MAIRIDEIKSSRLSADKAEFLVVGSGKYFGEVKLSFARECLDVLIDALVQAKQDHPPVNAGIDGNAGSTPPSDGSKHAVANPDEVRFEIPKNFTIGADASGRRLVLVILNHRLENQRGYALFPDAAIQMAARLTKSADALLAQKSLTAPIEPPQGS
jgi:hypothetical protein